MAFKGPECSICLERYNDKDKFPRMLSYGHSFCSSCLERLLYSNTIRCPTCRSLIVVPTGVAGLSKNFDLLKIVDNQPKQAAKNTGRQVCEPGDKEHPATFCCLDCKENMCKPDQRNFCRFTLRENKTAYFLLFTHNDADFSAIHSVTDQAAPRRSRKWSVTHHRFLFEAGGRTLYVHYFDANI